MGRLFSWWKSYEESRVYLDEERIWNKHFFFSLSFGTLSSATGLPLKLPLVRTPDKLARCCLILWLERLNSLSPFKNPALSLTLRVSLAVYATRTFYLASPCTLWHNFHLHQAFILESCSCGCLFFLVQMGQILLDVFDSSSIMVWITTLAGEKKNICCWTSTWSICNA